MYFIFMNLPLLLGGGYAEITSCMTVLSCEVGTVRFLFLYTSTALSSILKMRCFVMADEKIIGKSVNGARRWRIAFSKWRMASVFLVLDKVPFVYYHDKPFLVALYERIYVHVLGLDATCGVNHQDTYIAGLYGTD